MGRARQATWQSDVVPRVLVSQSYSSMSWETHPIDMTVTPQGWGPFGAGGPFREVDFINPQMFIDIGFSKGDNAQRTSPRYGNTTLFDDPSLDRTNNSSLLGSIRTALSDAQRGMSSTIANAPSVAGTRGRLMAALGMGAK